MSKNRCERCRKPLDRMNYHWVYDPGQKRMVKVCREDTNCKKGVSK